jgi:hypothetical protein
MDIKKILTVDDIINGSVNTAENKAVIIDDILSNEMIQAGATYATVRDLITLYAMNRKQYINAAIANKADAKKCAEYVKKSNENAAKVAKLVVVFKNVGGDKAGKEYQSESAIKQGDKLADSVNVFESILTKI